MNLAESLLHALKDHGVKEIFGLPGDFALPFFKVVEESGILPAYYLSHEPGLGFAADGASRAHCGPSVAAVTYGAGGVNMLNPVAAAYAERSPLIIISGGPGITEKSSGLLIHHQARNLNSQLEMFREVTCAQLVLDDVKTAPEQIAEILYTCKLRSRPVYIELPRDMVFSDCAAVHLKQDPPRIDDNALSACAGEIIKDIESAASPVLLVGIEIRRFDLEGKVTELAKKLGIPVVTTFMGRGLLANSDVALQGTYMGVAGNRDVTCMVEDSDCLICLGVIMSDTNFGNSHKRIDLRKVILASDGQVSMGYHVYQDLPLTALVDNLNSRISQGSKAQKRNLDFPRGLEADDQAVTPLDIARAINDMFDASGVMPIAADMGDCLFTALDIEYTDLVAPGYYATMGFGVPAGLGLQAASGRRTLILVGDGAFQMTGWELLNCPRYAWDPIVIVFNNSSWEMLRAFQPESAFNDLPALSFAKLAVELGGEGYLVNTRKALGDALKKATLSQGTFQLIEVILKPGDMSPTLSRYVDQVKKVRQKTESGQS